MGVRQSFRLFLAAYLFLQPLAAHAGTLAPAQVMLAIRQLNFQAQPKAFQTLRSLEIPVKDAAEAVQKTSLSKPVEMSAHFGQTLLFLLAVAGIEVAKEQWLASGESGKPSEASMLELAGTAAAEVLDRGNTYLSIMGASVSNKMFDGAVAAMAAWMADPASRRILHASIRGTIMSGIANYGWDAGSSLWTEASYLLEDKADYERSKSLARTTAGSVRALLLSEPSKRDRADLALAGKMAANMFWVAVVDQDLRSQWVNNFTRTRVMTGDFAIMTAALAAAGIGTAIFPGGGTAIGFIVGLSAVVIAINIPQEIKDRITSALHSPRAGINWGRMGTYEIEVREILHSLRWRAIPLHDIAIETMRNTFRQRDAARSAYLTVQFERMRLIFKTMLRRSSPVSSDEGRQQIAAVAMDLQKFFLEEAKVFEALQKQLPIDAPAGYGEIMSLESRKVEALADFFMQISLKLDGVFITQGPQFKYEALDDDGREVVKFVEVSYARGFDENKVLTALGIIQAAAK